MYGPGSNGANSFVMGDCSALDPHYEFSTDYRFDPLLRYDVEIHNADDQLVAYGSSSNQRARLRVAE